MPVYEYHCPKCGRDYLQICPISERDNAACWCGAKAERKLTVFSYKIKQIGKVRVNGEEVYTG